VPGRTLRLQSGLAFGCAASLGLGAARVNMRMRNSDPDAARAGGVRNGELPRTGKYTLLLLFEGTDNKINERSQFDGHDPA